MAKASTNDQERTTQPATTATASRLPPAPTRPAKPAKPELSKRDIEKLRSQLESERATLMQEIDAAEQDTIELDGADSGYDDEYGDAGTATFEREKQASMVQNLRDLVEQTDRALRAMDGGTYGLCETCGNPIAKERVLALPRVTQCRDCKQRDERFR